MIEEAFAKYLESYTSKKITDSLQLKLALDIVKNKHYAISINKHLIGICFIAVPIKKQSNTIESLKIFEASEEN